MKKYDEAISVLEEILQLRNADPNYLAIAYSSIAEVYLYRKNDPEKAGEYLGKSNAVPNAGWGKNKNARIAKKIREVKTERQ